MALMREINGSIEDLLKQHGKEEFAGVIKLDLPATEKNHRKFRQAIVDTLQHLREMNIRSAINGSDDALGKFYETFLKYANGAKEMGIVLTPRHITKFAADVVGVGPHDRVFDPACGTGGFLISAMENMRQRPGYGSFQSKGLYGVEQRDDVYGLAVVNMIFRGDGKSNVQDGNCFDHQFWLRDDHVWYSLDGDTPQGAVRPFTRVFMNPPFKLEGNPETRFVDYALSQLMPDGVMFVILPYVVVGGKRNAAWRRELLKRHTLLASIQLDKNLFYPVLEATYALIIRAHVPHRTDGTVFMGRLFDDDHRPRRSKMLSEYESVDNYERLTDEVRRFILGKPVDEQREREQAVAKIKESFDLSPEGYLPNAPTSVDPGSRAAGTVMAELMVASRSHKYTTGPHNTDTYPLKAFIDHVEHARIQTMKAYPRGDVPLVSATADENGIADWLAIPDDKCNQQCITISLLHNTKPCQAFWHPYRFGALHGKVMVLKPCDELLAEPDAIIYLCEAITATNSWRYHYARGPSLDDLTAELPSTDGGPDIDRMAQIVQERLGR